MMDLSEYTRVVFNRIQKIEPKEVRKIIGYLLLQDHGDEQIVRLACGPDQSIREVIYKAKMELQIPASSPPISPSVLVLSPLSRRTSQPVVSSSPYWEPLMNQNPDFSPSGLNESFSEILNQTQFLSLDYPIEPSGLSFSNESNFSLSSRRQFADMPVKTCHFFNKGFCRHGNSCKFYHGQSNSENFSQIYGYNEDHMFLPGSLEKLEIEIVDLLKSRKGNPISIASLPMIYYERYGKVLQAEGYLTESQRHGKAGYSLTKLLARLRNSIRLIDRPHGQHAVILTEDIPTFMDNRNEKNDPGYRNEKNDPGPIVNGSRQIYLTFPADSTFSEEDVSNYFETFGPVEDVRIPCQQKRMFGFVTFVSADTVKVILAKGNPHYVCGARVLVKPYREKSKFIDRNYQDRIETSLYYTPHYTNMDSELNSTPRSFESSWLSRRHLMDEQEQLLKSERNRLPGLNLVRKLAPNSGYFMDGLKTSQDNFDSWPSEQYDHLLDVLRSSPPGDDKPTNTTSNYTELESNPGFDLPESPFAPSVASGISTVL